MTKITIDYNNDMVMINPDERYESAEYDIAFSESKRGHKLQQFLYELLNDIEVNKDSIQVELESLDEENRTSIGEW